MKTIFVGAIVIFLFSCSLRPTITSSVIGQATPVCTYSHHNGESFQQPVQIAGISTPGDGLAAEYHYISNTYGNRGTDWFLMRQTLVSGQKKIVDIVEIQLQNPAERKCIYFDASNFIQ